MLTLNILRSRQNGRHFPDDILKWIFQNEKVSISINISLKFVPRGPIHNNPTLVQVMAWRRPGDKPLSEPMTVRLPTHLCVTRPQWVNRTHICPPVFTYSNHLWLHANRLSYRYDIFNTNIGGWLLYTYSTLGHKLTTSIASRMKSA